MADRPYVRPTLRQRELLAALLATGSLRKAADQLGITTGAASSQLRNARRRTGFDSTEQMIYAGARDGWLSVHETGAEVAAGAL